MLDFDSVRSKWDPDAHTVTVDFLKGVDRRRPTARGRRVGRLVVRFGDARGDRLEVVGVTLEAPSLSPTALQRFPWARWIAAAEASAQGDRLDRRGKWRTAIRVQKGVPLESRRPGRKGHPREFYERIAARYQALVADGATDPTSRIADDEGYSRSTAAGWIRRARALDLLPPARHGRAG